MLKQYTNYSEASVKCSRIELGSLRHYWSQTQLQSGTRKSGAETFAPLEAVFLAAAFG